MKAVHPETELTAAVDALFRRWPSLVGFAVRADERDLVLTDVETALWQAPSPQLCVDIAAALRELVEEEPAALALLPGRTFARTLH